MKKEELKRLKKDELIERLIKTEKRNSQLNKMLSDLEDEHRGCVSDNAALQLYKMNSEKWQFGLLEQILESDFMRGQLILKCESEINALIDKRVTEKLSQHTDYYDDSNYTHICYDGVPIDETDSSHYGF